MVEIRPATEEEQALAWLDGQIALREIAARETKVGGNIFQQVFPDTIRITLYETNAWRALASATLQPVTIERLGEGYEHEVAMRFEYGGAVVSAYENLCNLTDAEKEKVVG